MERPASRVFGFASVLTPFFMGRWSGRSSGEVPAGNATGNAATSWSDPLSIAIGLLFVATSAYLAAVFLVNESRRAHLSDLERYFATRAVAAAIVAGVLAVVGLILTRSDATYVYDGLIPRRTAARDRLDRLRNRSARPPAKTSTAVSARSPLGAVAAMIWGWGVAQYPYLLPRTLTISEAAAPSATLTSILIVFGVAVGSSFRPSPCSSRSPNVTRR